MQSEAPHRKQASAQRIEAMLCELFTIFASAMRPLGRDAAVADLGIGARELAELRRVVEDEFAVAIADDELALLLTIGDVVDFVAARIGASAA